MVDFKNKYLKYKTKYLVLKTEIEGGAGYFDRFKKLMPKMPKIEDIKYFFSKQDNANVRTIADYFSFLYRDTIYSKKPMFNLELFTGFYINIDLYNKDEPSFEVSYEQHKMKIIPKTLYNSPYIPEDQCKTFYVRLTNKQKKTLIPNIKADYDKRKQEMKETNKKEEERKEKEKAANLAKLEHILTNLKNVFSKTEVRWEDHYEEIKEADELMRSISYKNEFRIIINGIYIMYTLKNHDAQDFQGRASSPWSFNIHKTFELSKKDNTKKSYTDFKEIFKNSLLTEEQYNNITKDYTPPRTLSEEQFYLQYEKRKKLKEKKITTESESRSGIFIIYTYDPSNFDRLNIDIIKSDTKIPTKEEFGKYLTYFSNFFHRNI